MLNSTKETLLVRPYKVASWPKTYGSSVWFSVNLGRKEKNFLCKNFWESLQIVPNNKIKVTCHEGKFFPSFPKCRKSQGLIWSKFSLPVRLFGTWGYLILLFRQPFHLDYLARFLWIVIQFTAKLLSFSVKYCITLVISMGRFVAQSKEFTSVSSSLLLLWAIIKSEYTNNILKLKK